MQIGSRVMTDLQAVLLATLSPKCMLIFEKLNAKEETLGFWKI